MTKDEIKRVKALFGEWFRNGGAKNPTDPNTKEKYDFIVRIGWQNLQLMQEARKANVKPKGYPNPWTKQEYWTS